MSELLAPAGSPDAGYAALAYGADALYLGLNRFSARAEADNFTPDQLAEITAYAHSLAPRRTVYLTLNTLVKQHELDEAARTLFAAAEAGVDAVIVQDLGIARLVKESFPSLRLHASTQMAVHSLEGAKAAAALGFDRVVLARELTLAEIEAIAREAGLEIEIFIHGTLCYSYSGLCLFSSMATGRSGNRGRCVYSCREAAETPAGRAHLFSLKDMALGDRVADLVRAGVVSLKIEGRKKSPLYVAATVDHYRKLLDGAMTPDEAEQSEARLKTIFARPWTKLFLDGKRNPEAADPEVVGHRGSPFASIERIAPTPSGIGIVFTPRLPLERHDGIQTDVPGQDKPFGFPVDNLYSLENGIMRSAYEIPVGSRAAVTLPPDAPPLSPGMTLYLASSQAVKRSFPFRRPKSGEFGVRYDVRIEAAVKRTGDKTARIICAAAMAFPPFLRNLRGGEEGEALSVALEAGREAFPARDAAGAESAAKKAFERLGGGLFRLGGWRFDNPDALFVQPSVWNGIRRQLVDALERAYLDAKTWAEDELVRRILPPAEEDSALVGMMDELASLDGGGLDVPPVFPGFEARRIAALEELADIRDDGCAWSVWVDDTASLAAFMPDDFAACREVTALVLPGAEKSMAPALAALAEKVGEEKIRLAPPLLVRDGDETRLNGTIETLYRNGWTRWCVSSLAGWHILSRLAAPELSADWPLSCLNRLSARQLLEMGMSAVTLSPEDESANMAALVGEFPRQAVVVAYADVPLFISAACAHAHIGMCRSASGSKECAAEAMPIRMDRGGSVVVWPAKCGSVVTGDAPFSLAGELDALRAMGARNLRVDLRWRPYTPDEAVSVWRACQAGSLVGETGNFKRGLL